MIFDLTTHLPHLEMYFRAQPATVFAYLFSSQARGMANVHSDVDIGVLLSGN